MKQKIPLALREQVWLFHLGDKYFKQKCNVIWCENIITPFSFEAGHNIPESKGGTTDINNLRPICGKCNRSMGSEYTIDEFSALSQRRHVPQLWECFRYTKKSQPIINAEPEPKQIKRKYEKTQGVSGKSSDEHATS
jgi:5-methylcytosine-specific restriction endonuclease McrA